MDVLQEWNQISGCDYRIKEFDGWRLRIISGTSISYPDAKSAEITFEGVSYIGCPVEFSHATFRHADESERFALRQIDPFEDMTFVIAIDAETLGRIDPHTFYIVAEGVAITRR